MKNQLSLSAIALSLGMAITAISGFNQSTLAQISAPEDQGYQSNEQDSLYGGSATGINPLDLIHRANLSNGRSVEEFNRDTEVNMTNSAAEFKRLQQQQIQQQELPTPSPEIEE